MNTFFITDDGQLIEAIQYTTVLTSYTPVGPMAQPVPRLRFEYKRQATDEDRRRIPKEFGGEA